MSKTIEDLFNLIENGQKELKQEIRDLRSDINKELESLKLSNIKLEKENDVLKNKLLLLERKTRKYNLVIYGLEESEREVKEDVLEVLSNIIQIQCTPSNFRDIYRIGKKVEGQIRPIVIEVLNYQLKLDILINARAKSNELKRCKIFISQDYCPEDYQKRKFLAKHLKAAKEKQYKAFIKGDTLVVNGEQYSYETLKNKTATEQNKHDESPTSEVNEYINLSLNENKVIPVSNSAPTTPTLTQILTQLNTHDVPLKADEKKRKLEDTPSKPTGSKQKISTRSQIRRKPSQPDFTKL